MIIQKKTELLAPAGNFTGFLAVIKAGADAVYFSGKKYGARAYADNFNDEELLELIKVAHLFKRKTYLTVNTLIKEYEISDLEEYLSPLVDAGLDGVIMQDVGAIFLVHSLFPDLAIHISTQMSITTRESALLLKRMGIERIVPARELSLAEIKLIKETGMEVECFIHGAMCYCYSGYCLFSSIVGQRSGNRGRCA